LWHTNEIYEEKAYRIELGEYVVDVGAAIREICIYFALREGRKVIGIEPCLLLHKIGIQNIFSNGPKNIV